MGQIKERMIPYMKAKEIEEIVVRLAREIEREYHGKEILCIVPLKGSCLFAADLTRKIRLPMQIDFVQLSTAKTDHAEKQGDVKIVKDINSTVSGKHILILEEIIDGGRALSFLKNRILASGPASVKIVTLLDKPARRMISIKADYIGRTIEDRFVIGYGLDEGGLGRNYPDLYYLKH